MYSTCLFCNNTLGSNESIEHFPVGRRLSFDSATGRLWVVCRTCERWNLSPLETRWEAIEEAERLFRGTKLRVSTDNIGLAQLKDGTELVRVGKPIRTEFAAWRYGDQFGRRWRRYVVGSVVVATGPGVQCAAQIANYANSIFLNASSNTLLAAGVAGVAFAGVGTGLQLLRKSRDRRTWASVRDDSGALHRISRHWMDQAVLTAPTRENGWKLNLSTPRSLEEWEIKRQEVEPKRRQKWNDVNAHLLSNENALRALATILPHVNRGGGSGRTVTAAVNTIAVADGVASLMPGARSDWWARNFHNPYQKGHFLMTIPAVNRLALEMSLHETDERRAMEGELHELEQRWKEADAIAKIADEMFLSETIDARMRAFANKTESGD